MRTRSCGFDLTYNMKCPRCGRAHYNPARRKRVVNWKAGTRVRILDPAFGYKGKKGEVRGVDAEHIHVRVILGKKPGDHDDVAYRPEHVRKMR